MGNRYTVRHGASSPVEYPDKLLKYELGFCDTDEVLYIKNGKAEVKPVAKVLKELSSVPSELYPVSEKVMLDYFAGTTYFQSIAKKIYPVGSIYMSTSSTNPQTIFGGTWVAWGQGRVPVGVDASSTAFDTVEKSGGNSTQHYKHGHTVNRHTYSVGHTHTINSHTHTTANHTLTVNEMPSHMHPVIFANSANSILVNRGFGRPPLVNNIDATSNADATTNVGGNQPHNYGNTGGTSLTTNTSSISNTGAASPTVTMASVDLSVLQPYITCYMWKRIA